MEEKIQRIKIKSAENAHLFGNWYKNLIGTNFNVVLVNQEINAYVVYYGCEFRKISIKDC